VRRGVTLMGYKLRAIARLSANHSKTQPHPIITSYGVSEDALCAFISINQSINQSVSLIATLWPESRIANDMQLKF